MYELPELPGYNYVDLNAVIKSKKYSTYIKRLAKAIQNNGFFTVADFLKNLSPLELDDFMNALSDTSEEKIDASVLVTTLLSTGEGLDISFEEDPDFYIFDHIIADRVDLLIKYTLFESLARKDYVIPYYENWTLDTEDASSRIVVSRPIDDSISKMIQNIWEGKQNGSE